MTPTFVIAPPALSQGRNDDRMSADMDHGSIDARLDMADLTGFAMQG
ncbi:hypothetical protein HL653_20555 [Sphingomonas sp. AP4-R1]|nr:hypothetical protein [Sphingomonas sp. AP4-R1]QJU59822.1 hypothetical protein HL653_20555 [Sphingomonas sp. AP4-R1]